MTTIQLESKALELIQKLAIRLINKHLPNSGWKFQWDNAKRRLGYCRFGPKIISLSRTLVLETTLEQIEDTILHEIAHVMAGYRAGHGWQWKRVARSIGCSAERCHNVTTKTGAKYEASCKCETPHYKFRRPKHGLTGYRCSACKTKLTFERI